MMHGFLGINGCLNLLIYMSSLRDLILEFIGDVSSLLTSSVRVCREKLGGVYTKARPH